MQSRYNYSSDILCIDYSIMRRSLVVCKEGVGRSNETGDQPTSRFASSYTYCAAKMVY